MPVCHACAEATRRLQRVIEAHGDVPPVQHDRAPGSVSRCKPPQPGITIAQHCRRRVRMLAGRRAPARTLRSRPPGRYGQRRSGAGCSSSEVSDTAVAVISRIRSMPKSHIAPARPELSATPESMSARWDIGQWLTSSLPSWRDRPSMGSALRPSRTGAAYSRSGQQRLSEGRRHRPSGTYAKVRRVKDDVALANSMHQGDVG
jgi:hypothetical protein